MSESEQVQVYTSGQERFGHVFMRVIGPLQVWIYRLSGGRWANTFNGGKVALLTMTGRRSGRKITVPLVYAEDGDNILFAASKGGMSKHPVWYRNLVAYPEVEVQVGAQRSKRRMREASEAEAPALWAKLDAVYPDFSEYRERARLKKRVIPLLIMEPR